MKQCYHKTNVKKNGCGSVIVVLKLHCFLIILMDSKSLPWISRFTASMIKIFERDGGDRTVGSKPYRFQVLAQVVGSGCWLLPKPMYNVTDKQVDHSPSSVFFFLFKFFLLALLNGAVAGITERSMVSLNDPTRICPTIPSNRTYVGPCQYSMHDWVSAHQRENVESPVSCPSPS